MKKLVKKLKDGRTFALPEQWKEFLGQDVLNLEVSVSSRLKEYGMSSPAASHFVKSLKTIPDFLDWYDPKVQKKLSTAAMILTKDSFSEKKKREITEKQKKTCMIRYGHTSSMGNPEVKEKRQQTFKAKFGGPSPFSDKHVYEKLLISQRSTQRQSKIGEEDVRKKIMETLVRKTGFPYPNMKSKEEIKELLISKSIKPLEDIFNLRGGINYKAECLTCGRTFQLHFVKTKPTVCPYCTNSHTTELESQIASELEKLGNTVVRHYFPKWLERKELDIYLPDFLLFLFG